MRVESAETFKKILANAVVAADEVLYAEADIILDDGTEIDIVKKSDEAVEVDQDLEVKEDLEKIAEIAILEEQDLVVVEAQNKADETLPADADVQQYGESRFSSLLEDYVNSMLSELTEADVGGDDSLAINKPLLSAGIAAYGPLEVASNLDKVTGVVSAPAANNFNHVPSYHSSGPTNSNTNTLPNVGGGPGPTGPGPTGPGPTGPGPTGPGPTGPGPTGPTTTPGGPTGSVTPVIVDSEVINDDVIVIEHEGPIAIDNKGDDTLVVDDDVEEDVKEEDVKEEDVKEEDVKEEDVKEEDVKEEDVKEEDVKEEDVKEEDVKEEDVQEEDVQEEDVQEEDVQEEDVKEEDVEPVDTKPTTGNTPVKNAIDIKDVLDDGDSLDSLITSNTNTTSVNVTPVKTADVSHKAVASAPIEVFKVVDIDHIDVNTKNQMVV